MSQLDAITSIGTSAALTTAVSQTEACGRKPGTVQPLGVARWACMRRPCG